MISVIGGIRNFGWVAPDLLARGEQPLDEASFAALRDLGIKTILSLRPDGEEPSPLSGRPWPAYQVADEKALTERIGLRFRHVPMADFSAPSPGEIATALALIDAELKQAPAVYVHCRAGAGRTGLVAAAWSVSHGGTGDRAAAEYLRFMQHIGLALGASLDEQPAFFRRVGQPEVWWALREIVAALGSPVTREPPYLLPAARPPGADGWEEGYRDVLRPWRPEQNGRP